MAFVFIPGGESCSATNDRARLASSFLSGRFVACPQAADIFLVLRPSGSTFDFDQIDDLNFSSLDMLAWHSPERDDNMASK